MVNQSVIKIRVGKYILLLTTECDCQPGIPFIDGSTPEYTSMSQVAVKKTIQHIEDGRLFWGVHLNSKHVLDVQDEAGKSLRQKG